MISAGLGGTVPVSQGSVCFLSSARTSLQSLTHSLQMCTDGPVMILSTCEAVRPQKEQRGSDFDGRRRTINDLVYYDLAASSAVWFSVEGAMISSIRP